MKWNSVECLKVSVKSQKHLTRPPQTLFILRRKKQKWFNANLGPSRVLKGSFEKQKKGDGDQQRGFFLQHKRGKTFLWRNLEPPTPPPRPKAAHTQTWKNKCTRIHSGATAVTKNKIKIYAGRRRASEYPKFQLNIHKGSSTLGRVKEGGEFFANKRRLLIFLSLSLSIRPGSAKVISEQKRRDFQTEHLPSSYSPSRHKSRGCNKINDKLDDGVTLNKDWKISLRKHMSSTPLPHCMWE